MLRRRAIVALTIGLALIAAVALLVYARVGNPLNPFDDARFDAAIWATVRDDARAPMAQDLVDNHLHNGMSEAQIVSLIGKPDGNWDFGNYGRLRSGSHCMYYMIGNWSAHGMDQAYVIVHLDAQGQCVGAEVYGS